MSSSSFVRANEVSAFVGEILLSVCCSDIDTGDESVSTLFEALMCVNILSRMRCTVGGDSRIARRGSSHLSLAGRN